jgi:flagellar biosynthetic protein FliR
VVELLPLADFLVLNVTTFFLVVTRVSGIMLFGPLLSSNSLPADFRFYLTFAISILITPIVSTRSVDIYSTVDLILLLMGELLVGLILGTFLQMIFQALQLAGQTAGTQLGLALANVINPQFDEQTSTTAVVYVTVASLAFLGTGADREMLAALLETFAALPLGEVWFQESTDQLTLRLFQESMIFSVRVAAPVTIVMLLTEISMGFIGRTVPQLNILSIGFAIRIVVGIAITIASLGAATHVFQDYIAVAFEYSYEALANMAAEH